MLIKLSEADCRAAMRDGDFDLGIRAAAPLVVICLTQSWCPQWTRMRPFLEELAATKDAASYYVEYDREPFFEDFRAFKESTYKNEEVPYLRYYREGTLVAETNYIDRVSFAKLVVPAAT